MNLWARPVDGVPLRHPVLRSPDLECRIAAAVPLDDGRVEDGASLADKARFDQIEHLHVKANVADET